MNLLFLKAAGADGATATMLDQVVVEQEHDGVWGLLYVCDVADSSECSTQNT